MARLDRNDICAIAPIAACSGVRLRVAGSPTALLRCTAMRLTAVFEPAEEGGFIASVEELPGANTQGETLDEARANLLDAVALLLDTNREAAEREIAGRSVIREPLHLGE
ncbi:MAG: type II toxin-antitoxin system HicB family antitoxin [Candidatus Binatia bacterium]